MEDLRPKEGRRLCSFDWSPELVPGRDLLLLVPLPPGAKANEVKSDFDDALPQMLVEKKGIVPWMGAELAERCMARLHFGNSLSSVLGILQWLLRV